MLKDPKSPTDAALAPDLFAAMERASERTGACQLDTPQIIEVDRVARRASPPGTSSSRAPGAA